METFRLGGRDVGRLGFGAMQLPTEPARRAASVAVARRAAELGVTLIDTAHLYGWGANEELLAEALFPYPAGVLVTTKVGIRRGEDGGIIVDGRPELLRGQVEQALRRLRVDRLDLLQLHRLDPAVPLAEQLGALADLQEAGLVGQLGLSEVSVAELAEARQVAEIASVQNRYSVLHREHDPVLAACGAAGVAFLPWRPVADATEAGAAELDAVAAELGASVAQVSLAWLLHRSPVVLPIPGTASLAHLAENVAAADLRLTAGQQARLDRLAGS